MKIKNENKYKYKLILENGTKKTIEGFIKTKSGYVPSKPYKIVDGNLAILMQYNTIYTGYIVIPDEEFNQIRKEIKKYKKKNKKCNKC